MQIVAETERLLLRKYSNDDLPLLHALLSNPITMGFYIAPFTTEQSAAWMVRSLGTYESLGWGRYAVIRKEDQAFIGCVGFFEAEILGKPEHDLGYIIDHNHWGHGYATEAAQACVDLTAKEKWFSRIAITMASDHTKSRLVAERLGAKLDRMFINPKNRGKEHALYVLDI
jgi:[ribosomal protein S5]-alanine N-acetyltransferase